MIHAIAGKYAVIDLSDNTTEIVAPGEDFYRKFLSGYGLGAAVITRRQPPGIDPLAPESHLGFCSGLLTGTGALFSGRFMVVGKSPLTGGWGDANGGGAFSLALKRSGFDAIFITGQALKPVWIAVLDGKIDIRGAEEMWGQDIIATEASIRKELANPKVQVAAIGISGEKRSLISGIATDGGRIAARSGLGAVMGSKNLKALAVYGKTNIRAADPKGLKGVTKTLLEEFKKSSFIDRFTLKYINPIAKLIGRTGLKVPPKASLVREVLRRYGTSGFTMYSAMTGDTPIRNWSGVGLSDYTAQSARKVSDEKVLAYQKKRYACQGCPLGCGGIIDIRKGKYRGQKGHKPEYETLGAFGGLLLMDNLDAINELNERCNRAAIDTISTGAVVAFAIECFEEGILTEEDTGGLCLGWGQTEAIVQLTEMIIQRRGIGDILADGVKVAAQKIGQGSEAFAMHAGGQELPMHDTRLDPGYAIAYQCEPTPGRHTISCYLYAGLFGVADNYPRAQEMMAKAKGKHAKEIALYAASSYYMQVVNAAGLCLFGAMTGPLPVVGYINAATGWQLSPDEILLAGERILNLRKAFNLREGLTPEDSRLGDRALGNEPLAGGPLKGIKLDMAAIEETFFRIVGWDPTTGGPTAEKLAALDILKYGPHAN